MKYDMYNYYCKTCKHNLKSGYLNHYCVKCKHTYFDDDVDQSKLDLYEKDNKCRGAK